MNASQSIETALIHTDKGLSPSDRSHGNLIYPHPFTSSPTQKVYPGQRCPVDSVVLASEAAVSSTPGRDFQATSARDEPFTNMPA